MKIWYNNIIATDRQLKEVNKRRIHIGRHPDNDIVLDSPFVAAEAAVLIQTNGSWELTALGLGEILLGDRALYGGDRCEIDREQEIRIYPFTLTLDLPQIRKDTQKEKLRKLDEGLSSLIRSLHVDLLEYLGRDLSTVDPAQLSTEQVLGVEKRVEHIAEHTGVYRRERAELITHTVGHCVRSELLKSLSTAASTGQSSDILGNSDWTTFHSGVPDREEELVHIVTDVKRLLRLSEHSEVEDQLDNVEQNFWTSWELISGNMDDSLRKYLALRYVKKEIKDIVFGFGPLEDLLRLPTISEIMVVDRDHIYIEKNGVIHSSGRRFVSDEVTISIIDRIVSRIGRRIDKSSPLVDARLPDGSRVNAVIPPLAVSGPCLTIRKFPLRRLLIDDLVTKGALTRTVAEFLRAAVLHRRNILISGGTGTGKTTLLNCLSDFIPDKERVVTVEDTAELQLNKEHVVRMETKEANIEGAGAYTIRDLVHNALRMRPDRVVVGECRGPEALDMLQAMNTGHDGSLTTIHANSAQDVTLRLEVLVQMASDLPVSSIRQQIVSAIDLIVQLHRMRDGRRCVSQVAEVVDIDPNSGIVRIKDLFTMDESSGLDAELTPTGQLPTFMGDLIAHDLIDLESFFL